MRQKINGLNDSDKIFVTAALWMAAVSLFATALTLPMLPDMVTIFYKSDDNPADYYSKYNNLLIVLASVIPMAIVLFAASMRKRGKMTSNFVSTLLFCIMLSACLSGIAIYGIVQQFNASGVAKTVDTHSLIALMIALLLSMFSASFPGIFSSEPYQSSFEKQSEIIKRLTSCMNRFWNVGAYGFILVGVACSFLPGGYSYIPIAGFAIVELAVFLEVSRRSDTDLIEVAEAQAVAKDEEGQTESDAE